MESVTPSTLDAARKTIDELRKRGAPPEPISAEHRAAWANILGPSFATDNSASLLDGMGRRAAEQRAGQAILTAEREAREKAEYVARWSPKPKTAEDMAREAAVAEHARRSVYAATGYARPTTGTAPGGLPAVPDAA